MISRRNFLGTASFLISPGIYRTWAEDAGENSPKVPPPTLSPEELFLFTTVRLTGSDGKRDSAGTGFIFSLFEGAEKSVIVVVTNRHVAEHLVTCSFLCHKRYVVKPDYEKTIGVEIHDFANSWIPHPTEDLAIIPISPYINVLSAKGTPPYFVRMNHNNIPSQDTLDSLSPIEEVVTVGYPGNFMDAEHNVPLFHSGHTATPVFLPFKTQTSDESHLGSIYTSNKSFLVDFTTWYGASGSPVFLYDKLGYITRGGQSYLGGQRLWLLGIVSGLASQKVSGEIILNTIPAPVTGTEQVNVPTNLGICLLSSSVMDSEGVLLSRGLKVDWQYESGLK